MERRTASRKAALAFSIRCQRSATWMAFGSALAAASPYPPPRSRDTMLIAGCFDSHAPNGRSFPVGQQGNDPPTLQIAHDGPVPTVSPERPVIDTHNKQWIRRHRRPLADHPQQGIVADRQHEPLGEACCRPAAERQPQVMDNVFEPCRPTPSKRNDVFSEPLREDPPAAMRHLACEAPRE